MIEIVRLAKIIYDLHYSLKNLNQKYSFIKLVSDDLFYSLHFNKEDDNKHNSKTDYHHNLSDSSMYQTQTNHNLYYDLIEKKNVQYDKLPTNDITIIDSDNFKKIILSIAESYNLKQDTKIYLISPYIVLEKIKQNIHTLDRLNNYYVETIATFLSLI